jgi:hypothetical protein
MKNVHLIPTDKPSRLCINGKNQMHIYITSDEEIKQGDWYYYFGHIIKYEEDEHTLTPNCKKIILTTDQDLIADGVQAIDDEFLEWFVNNPSCEYVDQRLVWDKEKLTSLYKIIIPQEEPKPVWKQIIEDCGGEEAFMEAAGLKPKQETLEEAAEKYVEDFELSFYNTIEEIPVKEMAKKDFIEGAKCQAERMFEIMDAYVDDVMGGCTLRAEQWFEQFKQQQNEVRDTNEQA